MTRESLEAQLDKIIENICMHSQKDGDGKVTIIYEGLSPDQAKAALLKTVDREVDESIKAVKQRMGSNQQGEIMLHGPDGKAGWEAPEVAYIMGYNQARRDLKHILNSELKALRQQVKGGDPAIMESGYTGAQEL